MITLPEVRVGEPVRHQALTIFPLFSPLEETIEYQLADEAIAAGTVTVEEVNEGGSVPTLLVNNLGDLRVLFIEGEQLKGAKQNRILNTSVLVAAHTKTSIPVSCVEQGRWHYRGKHFTSAETHSSPKLRQYLKSSVAMSLKAGRGYTSDQGAVWKEVSRQMESLDCASPTSAMSDTFDQHQASLDEFRSHLKYVEGATGVAVAVGSQIVGADMFDKPSTCSKVWNRLLTGVVLDALESGQESKEVATADVLGLFRQLRDAKWESGPAVGEGEEYRSDALPATHASSLALGDFVIHGSVVVAS